MTDEHDYFAEGADAALSGKSEDANPYDLFDDAEAAAAWADGWLSIHDEEEDQ